MPVGAFVPSELEYDYPRWTAPAIGSTDTGKAWAWNHAIGKYEPTTFLLRSAVSAYGLTLIDDADAATARTDAFGVARDANGNKPRLDAGTYFILCRKTGFSFTVDSETVS